MNGSLRTLLLLAAGSLLACGCGPSLYGDMVRIRAQIDELEHSVTLPENAPLWISEEDAAASSDFSEEDVFDRYIHDGTPHVPDFVYKHVLRKLHGMTDAEVEALSGGDFPYGDGMRNPASYRGRVWRIAGTILTLRMEQITVPQTPIREVFPGVAYLGSDRPFLFHLINKPDPLHPQQDLVEVYGVFVKIITVGSRGRRISAPLFLARSAKRYI
ncbi:MAG: hypothetical protein ACYTAF_02795 [Planctomycetota bacterium]